ncbi:hypothetical protein N8I77_007420 [Diaporthe amygdali]|uniref:Uncharacterized protein n=1 Tax=Phomopsis amygdali TaxID=1214568 RepID=A0AAD9W428_PHOAM|nr:hypothetical protein N8I77_007420 [Diaporthe amygdali]
MDRLAIRRIARSSALAGPTAARHMILQTPRHNARLISMQPRVAEASFWKSLVPKPLRRENRTGGEPGAPTKVKSKEWNPATFFIVIFLLIGSMSIQMISLRKNFDAFMRRSDVRIGLLREVVERIQNGETVDVEKVLGTGDPEREAEWEEVLNEIEKDSASRSQKKQVKVKAPATSSPVAKAVTVVEPRAESAPVQEPAKGRTAYFF